MKILQQAVNYQQIQSGTTGTNTNCEDSYSYSPALLATSSIPSAELVELWVSKFIEQAAPPGLYSVSESIKRSETPLFYTFNRTITDLAFVVEVLFKTNKKVFGNIWQVCIPMA